VNVVGIDLALPVGHPSGTRAFSLPVPSAQNLADFLSLLNGLLGQSGPVTRDVTATLPAKPTGATLLPQASTTKERGAKTGKTTVASLPPSLGSPVTSGTAAEMPVLIQTGKIPDDGEPAGAPPRSPLGETQGSSVYAQTQPVASRSDGATSTASSAMSPSGNPPGPVGDIAFALRLTWKPLGATTDLDTHSRSDAVPPGKAGLRNPIEVTSRIGQSTGLSEVASHNDSANTEKTEIPTPEPVPAESQPSRANDPPTHSSLSLLEPIPAHSPGPDSTIPKGAGLRHSDILVPVRHGDVTAGSAPGNRRLASEAAPRPTEIDAQPQGFATAPASVPEKTAASSPPAANSQNVPTPK
jgi:hypothetical protein